MITLVLLLLLYIIGQYSMRLLFLAFSRIVPLPFPYWLIALIFFPGTFVHETAHLITAVVLFLHVRGFHLFPEWKADHLTLGYVRYEKADFIRGFIVGVAPIPFGIAVLWMVFSWYFRTDAVWWITGLVGYVTFAISSTMFTSRSDLTDAFAFFVFLGLVYGGLRLVGIDLVNVFAEALSSPELSNLWTAFTTSLNLFLGISLAIHAAIIVLFRLIFRV